MIYQLGICVDPATASPAAKAIFDGPLKGKHLNIFKGLGNSAAALEAYLGMSGALAKGGLTAQERELIALTVGQANNCGYCVAAHTAIGTGAGLGAAGEEVCRGGGAPPGGGAGGALAGARTAGTGQPGAHAARVAARRAMLGNSWLEWICLPRCAATIRPMRL